MSAVPFFLMTGFLGSGKTTLLKRFIDTHADTRRLAIIQNEFADASVDGPDLGLSGKRFEILEINKGSVFCVCLLSDFVRSLRDLVDTTHPDAVILEATGLADPIAVAQLLQSPELSTRVYLAHIWSVVDVSVYERVVKNITRAVHQIRVADTVLLNKCDKTPPDAVEAVRNCVEGLAPYARIVQTRFCDVSLSEAFAPMNEAPTAVRQMEVLAAIEPGRRPDVASAALRITRRVCREGLDAFLRDTTASMYRLKGFVGLSDGTTVAVQSCFGDTTVVPVSGYVGPTEIVAMGPGLDARVFSARFEGVAG